MAEPGRRRAVVMRAFEASDEPALRRMAHEVVETGEMFVYEEAQGVLDYWLADGGSAFVAVDPDGEVLGTHVVKPNHPGRGSHVANAGYMVFSAHQGRGIGRRLGEHSIEVARAAGYRGVQFNLVVATNRSALALWESLGFREVGRLPGAFRHDREGYVDGLVFHLEL